MNRPTKEERVQFQVDYAPDTAFASYARVLQSKWREKQGYPIQTNKYGNYLERNFAEKTKSNFLTDKIKTIVTQEVLNAKTNGKLISEPRIWNNLLSSQPLCFNLFGELTDNLELATRFFSALFPNKIDEVLSVQFEHSPGRGNKQYTGDRSAFDVFIEYKNFDYKGFIGIEVKYSESLKEETQKKSDSVFESHKNEYTRLTTTKHFRPNSINYLRRVPISQIWRDHMLAISLLQEYGTGFFVFLYPSQNEECQKGVELYKRHLICEDENITGFCPRFLEDFIDILTALYPAEWTSELKQRYLG